MCLIPEENLKIKGIHGRNILVIIFILFGVKQTHWMKDVHSCAFDVTAKYFFILMLSQGMMGNAVWLHKSVS